MTQSKNAANAWRMDALETTREDRTGLPGLGGRPTMHPSWAGGTTLSTGDRAPGSAGHDINLDQGQTAKRR